MGFHAVFFGLNICHSNDLVEILSLIASDYSIINPEASYYHQIFKIKLHDDIISPLGQEFEIDVMDLLHTRFTYSKNPEILIGLAYCCRYMIYLGRVGDNCGVDDSPVTIQYNTLTDLSTWKDKLEEDSRIDIDIQLQMVGNCCS